MFSLHKLEALHVHSWNVEWALVQVALDWSCQCSITVEVAEPFSVLFVNEAVRYVVVHLLELV